MVDGVVSCFSSWNFLYFLIIFRLNIKLLPLASSVLSLHLQLRGYSIRNVSARILKDYHRKSNLQFNNKKCNPSLYNDYRARRVFWDFLKHILNTQKEKNYYICVHVFFQIHMLISMLIMEIKTIFYCYYLNGKLKPRSIYKTCTPYIFSVFFCHKNCLLLRA